MLLFYTTVTTVVGVWCQVFGKIPRDGAGGGLIIYYFKDGYRYRGVEKGVLIFWGGYNNAKHDSIMNTINPNGYIQGID